MSVSLPTIPSTYLPWQFHLPRYMVGTLELLVAENYLLVHLSGGSSRAQVPPLSWICQCYRTLDRRWASGMRGLQLSILSFSSFHYFFHWIPSSFVSLHPFPNLLSVFHPHLESGKPNFKSCLYHLLAVWLCKSHLTFLGVSFLICKMAMLIILATG